MFPYQHPVTPPSITHTLSSLPDLPLSPPFCLISFLIPCLTFSCHPTLPHPHSSSPVTSPCLTFIPHPLSPLPTSPHSSFPITFPCLTLIPHPQSPSLPHPHSLSPVTLPCFTSFLIPVTPPCHTSLLTSCHPSLLHLHSSSLSPLPVSPFLVTSSCLSLIPHPCHPSLLHFHSSTLSPLPASPSSSFILSSSPKFLWHVKIVLPFLSSLLVIYVYSNVYCYVYFYSPVLHW